LDNYINYKKIIKYLLLLLLATGFLLIFSLWTTPLYPSWYGCDASFFTMAGRGILSGWVPYEDFFDLKGPYFFFLEALGQLFAHGRNGAFVLQVIALFTALVLMIKTCRMFISKKKTFFVIAVFLIMHVATLWGGNTLEEYMLPLNLLSIYLVLKDMKNLDDIRGFSALICGVCFSVILFAKVTVASPIIGLVLAILFYFIRRKQYMKLITFLVYAFLGVLIGTTPLFIYFFANHALSDMLYSVFLFAFKRSVNFDQKFNLRWELKISGCYFAFAFALLNAMKFSWAERFKSRLFPREVAASFTDSDTQDDISSESDVQNSNISESDTQDCVPAESDIQDSVPVESDIRGCISDESCQNITHSSIISFILICILFISAVTAIALHFGDPFIYYFTTVYPVLMLTFIAIFSIYDPFTLFTNWRLDIPLIMFAVTMCYFASHTASTLNTVIYDRKNDTFQDDYQKCALEMASLIPENDRDSVYSFNMDMQWFEINNILPCYTYTINLQFFIALDNRIETEIIDKLNTSPPKWIVVGGTLSDYLPNINEVVITKYDFIYQNPYGSLYILK